ncbi:MAG: hypothetical protein LBH76_09835 [Propionibacteriaceae bacterium]|nr:hypothetical protein [Propionibacteriaceae bacterium]
MRPQGGRWWFPSGQAARAAGFAKAVTRADHAERLADGGYPPFRGLTGRGRNVWLDSCLDSAVFRDLGELRRAYDPAGDSP